LPSVAPLLHHVSSDPSSLLQLPDALLLAVLQHLADDPASLAAAAQTHSRLHQAAVLAPGSSISAKIDDQEQLASLLLYLERHGQYLDSITLSSNYSYGSYVELHAHSSDDSDTESDEEEESVVLWQLPASMQLHSLKLSNIVLNCWRQGDEGFQGVLAAGAPLKRLQLSECLLPDTCDATLTAALAELPALEHLSIHDFRMLDHDGPAWFGFHTDALDNMQQLTYLELSDVPLVPEEPNLQALTRLVDLRLHVLADPSHEESVPKDMLSGVSSLTRLELSGFTGLDGRVLAGKPMLQHLELPDVDDKLNCRYELTPTPTETATELLSQLQHLQQLTYLTLNGHDLTRGTPPAAAFSALTASSKLQHLDIGFCKVPAGAWQHMFPAGRQLSCLQLLNIASVRVPPVVADGRRIIACCPNLRYISICDLPGTPELRAALQGVDGLRVQHE
jgi:hypothetical protein